MMSHLFGDIGHTSIIQQQLQLLTDLFVSLVDREGELTYLSLSPDLIGLCESFVEVLFIRLLSHLIEERLELSLLVRSTFI
jgi:hypothetical protein